MSSPLKPGAVLCRDGAKFAVADVSGRLVVTTPAGDPFLDQAGLVPFADAAQVRDGVLRHSGVPIDVVRQLVRAHGGFEAAGPAALDILRAAGRPRRPRPRPSLRQRRRSRRLPPALLRRAGRGGRRRGSRRSAGTSWHSRRRRWPPARRADAGDHRGAQGSRPVRGPGRVDRPPAPAVEGPDRGGAVAAHREGRGAVEPPHPRRAAAVRSPPPARGGRPASGEADADPRGGLLRAQEATRRAD